MSEVGFPVAQRIGVVVLMVMLVAACGGGSTATAAQAGSAAPASSTAPAASTAPGGGSTAQPATTPTTAVAPADTQPPASTPAPGGTPKAELFSVGIGDKAKTWIGTCHVSVGTSVTMTASDADGTATFTWVGKGLQEVAGTLNGAAFKATGLSIGLSLLGPHNWAFSGTDSVSGKDFSGSIICN